MGKCFWLGKNWNFLIYATNQKKFEVWHRNNISRQTKSLLILSLLNL